MATDYTSSYRMKGFCYNHIPRQGKLGSVDKILDSLKQSAKCYFEAAEKFPLDDELHVCMCFHAGGHSMCD